MHVAIATSGACYSIVSVSTLSDGCANAKGERNLTFNCSICNSACSARWRSCSARWRSCSTSSSAAVLLKLPALKPVPVRQGSVIFPRYLLDKTQLAFPQLPSAVVRVHCVHPV
jgi:hypothetical protein